MTTMTNLGGSSSISTSLDAVAASQLASGLSSLELPYPVVEQVIQILPPDTFGLLAYGSRSRGDHLNSSDLDLLALVSRPFRATRRGIIHLSYYTEKQLIGATGTLFGYHLARDGTIIFDPDGILSRIFAQFTTPNIMQITNRIRDLSGILGVNAVDRHRYATGLCRLGRYLLRTAIYVKAFADGKPCFSIRELAERYAEPELITLLASDPMLAPEPSVERLDELQSRIAELVGTPPQIEHRSLEAVAIAAACDDTVVSQLATMAMSLENKTFDYSQLVKILL